MKKLVLLLILILVTFDFLGQETLNFTDSLGRKQGHWIFYGKDLPESSVTANGKAREGYYIDDRKEGTWISYHEDGKTPKLTGEYENNRPKGVYTKIGSSGILLEKGNFTKNRYQDSLKRFYPNGKLEYEAWYNEYGKEEGRVNFYYETGQLEFSYIAKNGFRSEIHRFDINGAQLPDNSITKCDWGYNPQKIKHCTTMEPTIATETEVSPFKENASKTPKPAPDLPLPPNTRGTTFNPNNYNKCYSFDNDPYMDGTFKDGKLWNGKLYVYDNDGILLKVEVYKNGVYHSDGQL